MAKGLPIATTSPTTAVAELSSQVCTQSPPLQQLLVVGGVVVFWGGEGGRAAFTYSGMVVDSFALRPWYSSVVPVRIPRMHLWKWYWYFVPVRIPRMHLWKWHWYFVLVPFPRKFQIENMCGNGTGTSYLYEFPGCICGIAGGSSAVYGYAWCIARCTMALYLTRLVLVDKHCRC